MPDQFLTDPQKLFLEKYLGVTPESAAATGEDDPALAKLRAQWQAAEGQMAPRLEGLVQSGAPNADRIEKAWQAATKMAAGGEFAKALAASQRIGAAIDQIAKPPEAGDALGVGGVSLVKLGVARTQWPAVHATAHSDLATLKAKLRNAYAPYPSESTKVEAAIGRIDTVISTLDDTLKDQLDDVYNAQTEEARATTVGVVKRTVARFKTFVDSDPVASAIDGNSFAPNIAPIGPIRKNLDAMMTALGG